MSTQETTVGFAAAASAGWGEQQLAAELRSGSVEAFNYLISLYHKPLYRFMARMLGEADAADVVQEIFFKVFRSAAHFQGRSSLKTWLYQIALHEAGNHRRWWRRHQGHETSIDAAAAAGSGGGWAQCLPDRGASPIEQALRSEQRGQLFEALRRVPEPFRAMLMLREIEGFSYGEIAEIAQVRVGTVKSRLLRGREMLRQQLQPHPAAAPWRSAIGAGSPAQAERAS